MSLSGTLWFLSFASSGLDRGIRSPLKRIRRQADEMELFGDCIRIWSEQDLDRDFCEKMRSHLLHGSRGYGYWCWKPQIVLQVFREMKDGDILLYVDAGCHLNPHGRSRLEEYAALAEEHNWVAFEALAHDGSGRCFGRIGDWTKGSLIDHFQVRDRQDVVEAPELGGTAFLVKKTRETVRFFESFREVFFSHFELCDDTPSTTPNLPGFVENRHDQSVFSIMGRLANIFSLSILEYDPVNGGDDWSCMRTFPIWAKHDKGGVRSLFPNWFKRVVHHLTGGRV